MSELKNCPFCGTKAVSSVFSVDVYNWYEEKVCCENCSCIISHPQAIQMWNTRPAEDALKAENESLKNKLALVKEHLVVHRDSALNNILEDKDQCRKVLNEFLAWSCNRLIELINADTENMKEN